MDEKLRADVERALWAVHASDGRFEAMADAAIRIVVEACAGICAERAKLWEREAAKIERLTGKWVDLKALSEDSRINEDAILALLEKPHVPAK